MKVKKDTRTLIDKNIGKAKLGAVVLKNGVEDKILKKNGVEGREKQRLNNVAWKLILNIY